MALTDTAIRGTKPGKKPFKIYDREGLFLLVNPGGSKLWRWRYRFDGKEKLMALGEYSPAAAMHFRPVASPHPRTFAYPFPARPRSAISG